MWEYEFVFCIYMTECTHNLLIGLLFIKGTWFLVGIREILESLKSWVRG